MHKTPLLIAASTALLAVVPALAQTAAHTAAPATPHATQSTTQHATQSTTQAPSPQLQQRSPGEPPPPAHPATPAQIREYLELTHSQENAKTAFGQLVAGSRARAPQYFPADFWSDLTNSLDAIDVVAQFTPIYQRYFSQEDMAAAIAFYKTPAGKDILQVQPLAASAAGELLRTEGQRVGQATFARHKAEIDAAVKAHQAAAAPKPTLNSLPSTPPATAPQTSPQKPQ